MACRLVNLPAHYRYTARNPSLELQNQAIHLASAFQLTGFSRVLGTMWNTKNDPCVAVSKMFYEYLLEEAAAMTVGEESGVGANEGCYRIP